MRALLKPLIVLLAVTVVIGTAWMWRRSPSRSSTAPGVAQGPAPSQRPLPFAQAAVLIHGEREWRAHAGVPLVAEVVVRNPLDSPVRLARAAGLAPRVRRQGGGDVPAAWVAVPGSETEIAPRDGVVLAWTLREGLPAGEYSVTVDLAPDVVTGEQPLAVPRVFAAPLGILAGEASAEERALALARMLQRSGDLAGALAALQAASGPDASLVLRLWTADALRESGREAEANAEYVRLASESVDAQRARGIANPEIPFWLAHAVSR